MEQLHTLLARWSALEPGKLVPLKDTDGTVFGYLIEVEWIPSLITPSFVEAHSPSRADLALLQAHVQAAVEAREWLWEVKRLSDGRYRVVINEPMTKEGTVFAVGNYAVPHPALAITAAYVAALEAVAKTEEVTE